MADMQLIEQVFEFLLSACAVEVVAILENCENVLLDRQFAENRRFLGQVSQPEFGAPMHRLGRQVLAIEQDVAAVRGDQPTIM